MVKIFQSLAVRFCVLATIIAVVFCLSTFVQYLKDAEKMPVGTDPAASNSTPLDYWRGVGEDIPDGPIDRPENQPSPKLLR